MNITYNKETITVAAMPKIKQDMREIKKIYTDNDLARFAFQEFHDLYTEITGELFPYPSDVLRINVNAYAMDYRGTHFRVEITNAGYKEMHVISFYATWSDENGMSFDKEKRWNQFKNRYEYSFNLRTYKLEGDSLSMILAEDGLKEAI